MSESNDDVVLTERRGRVLLITLNRPDAMNAINTPLAQALTAAIAELDDDTGLSAAVLTGAGRGFCAGMDLKAFAKEGPPEGFMEFIQNGAKKPLIAAVEGFALAGGLEVALVCDLIVAADDVKFGIPETARGLFAAGGGLFRLPPRIGLNKAMELALTAEPIPAQEALELGLVTSLTDKGAAVDGALELAEKVAKNAPLALAASKAILRETVGMTDAEAWDAQMHHMGVFVSNDAKEGPAAFAEKREPNWSGT